MAALSNILSVIQSTVVTATGLATPPTGSYNFFTRMSGITANFTAQINRGIILLPCVVVSYGDFDADLEYDITSATTKRFPVSIHWIAELGGIGGTQDAVSDQAINIGLAFDLVDTWGLWEVIEPCNIRSDVDSEINDPLAGASRKSIISASAGWTPGWQLVLQN